MEGIEATNSYIKALESTTRVNAGAIRQAIKALSFSDGSTIIDLPCGIGVHMQWMLEKNPNVKVTGLDINENHTRYAENLLAKRSSVQSFDLLTEDINKLSIADSMYDYVWCCDGLWAGPKEMGCVSPDPYSVLNSMKRIAKNGGTIAVLFWSGQKLLPGYPLLEAVLNATEMANFPFFKDTASELHYMRTPLWMKKTGLKNIRSQTFVADITGPFDEQAKKDMATVFNMFWARAQPEVSDEVWGTFQNISNPESSGYVLNQEGYAGYVNYTMFTGEVVK